MKAVASHYDDNPNALLTCQQRDCRFTGRPTDFHDAREYSLSAEDAFDCPCCGHSNVCEITSTEPCPAVPVVEHRGQTLSELYKRK